MEQYTIIKYTFFIDSNGDIQQEILTRYTAQASSLRALKVIVTRDVKIQKQEFLQVLKGTEIVASKSNKGWR